MVKITSAAINLDVNHGGASPKNTPAFMRASDTLAKSCNYHDQTLLIRNTKKWKEKISFSIRKLLISWHNAINAKNTLKTYFFWPTQPFRMPQSTAYALFSPVDESAKEWQKRVISHWVSNVFMQRNDGKKNLKKRQSNLPSDFQTVCSYCPTRGKLFNLQ